MGKVIITREFDYYEEQEELRRHLKAEQALNIIEEIDGELRNKLKHGDDEWLRHDGIQEYLEKIRETIWDSGVMRDG